VNADNLAIALGLNKKLALKDWQYKLFISGQGKNGSGDPAIAKIFDESVKILTNSSASPLTRIIRAIAQQNQT